MKNKYKLSILLLSLLSLKVYAVDRVTISASNQSKIDQIVTKLKDSYDSNKTKDDYDFNNKMWSWLALVGAINISNSGVITVNSSFANNLMSEPGSFPNTTYIYNPITWVSATMPTYKYNAYVNSGIITQGTNGDITINLSNFNTPNMKSIDEKVAKEILSVEARLYVNNRLWGWLVTFGGAEISPTGEVSAGTIENSGIQYEVSNSSKSGYINISFSNIVASMPAELYNAFSTVGIITPDTAMNATIGGPFHDNKFIYVNVSPPDFSSASNMKQLDATLDKILVWGWLSTADIGTINSSGNIVTTPSVNINEIPAAGIQAKYDRIMSNEQMLATIQAKYNYIMSANDGKFTYDDTTFTPAEMLAKYHSIVSNGGDFTYDNTTFTPAEMQAKYDDMVSNGVNFTYDNTKYALSKLELQRDYSDYLSSDYIYYYYTQSYNGITYSLNELSKLNFSSNLVDEKVAADILGVEAEHSSSGSSYSYKGTTFNKEFNSSPSNEPGYMTLTNFVTGATISMPTLEYDVLVKNNIITPSTASQVTGNITITAPTQDQINSISGELSAAIIIQDAINKRAAAIATQKKNEELQQEVGLYIL